jgi:hypothetical protein
MLSKMIKTAQLHVITVLFVMISGCGNSDSQQESVSGKPRVADDTSQLCSTITESFSLAKQCAVNSPYSEVAVTVDSNDDEVARNICADIANKVTKLTSRFSASWKLQIYSPYRSDKPTATCLLHS